MMQMPTRYESVGCDDGRFISPKESNQLQVGTQLRPDAHPDQQVQLVIKVKRNKEA